MPDSQTHHHNSDAQRTELGQPSTNARETAETAVLGAVLLAGTKALHILAEENLHPHHFHRPRHQHVFAAMLAIEAQGREVDTITLKARFDSPQSPVTPAEVELLAGSAYNLGNLRAHAQLIREAAWFDRAGGLLLEAQEALQARDRDRLLGAVADLEDPDVARERDVDNATEWMRWYDSEQKGWSLPWPQLTEAIGGGLNPGETTIIASWSGYGKTYLLSHLLRHIAGDDAAVLEFASEMHGPKRTNRMLASLTGIPKWKFDLKRLTPEELRRVAKVRLPYETVKSEGRAAEWYAMQLRRRKVDVAAIDTINNLPCSRVEEWDRAAGVLADAAANTGTHLIQVFQLKKDRDNGKKPPPVSSDLRFGSTFHFRARNVIMLHRDQEPRSTGDGQELWEPLPEGHLRVDKASHGDGDPVKAFLPVTFSGRRLEFVAQSEFTRAGVPDPYPFAP